MQQRVLLAGLLCLLSACHFSAGARKDEKTGLTLMSHGLSCQNFLLERNGLPLTDKDIRYGERITLLLENLSGFTEKDGLVYPGMQLDVKDDKGVVVSSFTDMLADVSKSGVSPEQARGLRAAYQSGPPEVVPGRSYTLSVHIWDKQGKGTLDATLPMDLRFPDTTGLHTTPQGITAIRIFMISDSGRVQQGHVPAKGHVGINFQGLKGFVADSGKVFPGGSLAVYDSTGKALFNTGDAFASQTGGFTDTQVKEGLRITVNMNPHLKGIKTIWKFRVWDKKGQGSIETEVPVILD
ncbi:hypothetical protein GA0116948_11926 [Chitinophaga costaii]|uniref:Uncharacterized protein n=1 Tax=Chitinophaga costaii TaxID=1335309 RepID=A0A1C4G1S0_9BACT|nr:hypothetical protein [Chitinophaga costaii]PUZ19959.1 hypothetical protein DCM91_19905 [Chitinophaga costaii]SCC61711.1 hypothetical protein GA0116948_11926 [Chitinophaga costaii]